MAVPIYRPPIRPDLPVSGLAGAINPGGLAGALGSGTTGLGAAGGGGSNPYAFTPYQPPPIPSGYYDPALDAQRGAASRGLLNTEQDIGLAGRRGAEDFGLDPNDPTYGYSQVGQIETGFKRNLADLTTGRDRGLQDIGTQRGYENVDYGRNIEALTRNYTSLGRQQAEQARKYGVTSGGIALLSASKRDANQALERRDLDTSHERTIAGLDTSQTRLGEDFTTGSSRLGEDHTNALGQAGTVYNRGVADRGTALERARSEDLFYGLDVDAQKQFQAQQAGYTAPAGPSNEFTRPDGTVVHVIRRGGKVYTYDQTGKLLDTRKAA